MARPLRIVFEDACYHIIVRGIRDDKIFYENRDREVFLNKIQENFEKYRVVCYAYCLMDNHFHLFIRTTFPNLPQVMHSLNSSYTNWFRKKHEIKGPILQGRYKSILVEKDRYTLVLSAYIHLNPIRAEITKNLDDYAWSSFNIYTGKAKPLNWLDADFILSYFDKNRKRYHQFVYEQLGRDLSKCVYKGCILGDENFIEEIQNRIEQEKFVEREIPQTKFLKKEIDARMIVKIVSDDFGIDIDNLYKKRKNNIPKKISLYLINRCTPLNLSEIGELFNMDYAAVSQSIKRFKWQMDKNQEIKKTTEMIIKKLEMSNVET